MKKLLMITTKLSNAMSILAGVVLITMTVITFFDVVLRYFGKPIAGAYELVAFMGVAVIALALPRASLMKAHVYVDLLVDKLPRRGHRALRILTRVLVFCMFLFAAWYFVIMARNFVVTNSVTITLKVPFYPVVYALAASAIVQCLVSICEIMDDKGEKQ
jgi:TRAP-type C4-dicarboxylate transport system permease small subunit